MPYVINDEESEYYMQLDYVAATDPSPGEYKWPSYCFFYVQDEGRGIKEHLNLQDVDNILNALKNIRKKMIADGTHQ